MCASYRKLRAGTEPICAYNSNLVYKLKDTNSRNIGENSL